MVKKPAAYVVAGFFRYKLCVLIHQRDQCIDGFPIKVKNLDFPYEYKHEDPFSVNSFMEDKVNVCFDQVFNLASEFLK